MPIMIMIVVTVTAAVISVAAVPIVVVVAVVVIAVVAVTEGENVRDSHIFSSGVRENFLSSEKSLMCRCVLCGPAVVGRTLR